MFGWRPPAIKLSQSWSSVQSLFPLLFWSDAHKGNRRCQGFLSWRPHPMFPVTDRLILSKLSVNPSITVIMQKRNKQKEEPSKEYPQ